MKKETSHHRRQFFRSAAAAGLAFAAKGEGKTVRIGMVGVGTSGDSIYLSSTLNSGYPNTVWMLNFENGYVGLHRSPPG